MLGFAQQEIADPLAAVAQDAKQARIDEIGKENAVAALDLVADGIGRVGLPFRRVTAPARTRQPPARTYLVLMDFGTAFDCYSKATSAGSSTELESLASPLLRA